jgi:exocyst complex component 4
MLKQKTKNGASVMAAQLVVSPISPAMAPAGDAQHAAGQLLRTIFECLLDILGRCYVSVGLISYKSVSY